MMYEKKDDPASKGVNGENDV
ncbi:hypothetical protein BSG1_13261 [Bacillus sp. SG-1]|nr:hypothetical protein BSG1_13261 [Bacillus sp. SG-1]